MKTQDWSVGSRVNVGYLKGLQVTGREKTPEGLPSYLLRNRDGTKRYRFIPHYGLRRVS